MDKKADSLYKRFINLLFNVVFLSYLVSFSESNNIIQINDLKHINVSSISTISLEKYKNYGLIHHKHKNTNNTNNTTNIVKLHYPNNKFIIDQFKKIFNSSYEDKIIYFEEPEIPYKTILFILFIIISVSNSNLKNIGDSLVTDLNLLITKKSNYKLSDIAGMHEIKSDIKEYINFINNKEKYLKFGARLPKGVLLVGPPGCGKTLIAKSIAGETGINMYAISASDINEMFVGVGSKRIRKLFELARENSPSIIFIDEIDSIGMKRGGFSSGGREYDNVLNKILVEMDGFNDNENIMVFGATNRVKDLDSALLRSGRFDRKIYIDYPNKNERKEILEYYVRDKTIEYTDDEPSKEEGNKEENEENNEKKEEENKEENKEKEENEENEKEAKKEFIGQLSKLMCGLSGADIENIINQSAIHAVKNNHEKIKKKDITDSYDEVMIGIKKKDRIMSDDERNIVAHHEIGHAIIGYLLKNTSPPIKISIIPRGENILGYAQQEPTDNKLYSKNELLDKICVLLGGRISEEVFFGKDNITTGASDDIEKLTKIINSMVFEYGMFDKNYNYKVHKYLGESKLDELNEKSNNILDTLEKKVRGIIEDNKDNISSLSKQLLEDDEIYNSDIEKIVGIKCKSTL